MWRKGKSHSLLVRLQISAAIVENSMEVPQKMKNRVPYDPAIPVLGIYPQNLKIFIHKDVWTPIFITASFPVAKTWKQLKCPLIED